MKTPISFRLNGRPATLDTDGDRKLLWVLRTDLGLTGTKYGCGAGICGSCTVVVDGKAVRSCQVALKDVQGKDVTTIEGLARDGQLHPLQASFIEHGAFQCGYCTPGMIMAAKSLLAKNPNPTEEEIRWGISGNLCRCTGYMKIVEAIQYAAAKLQSQPEEVTA